MQHIYYNINFTENILVVNGPILLFIATNMKTVPFFRVLHIREWAKWKPYLLTPWCRVLIQKLTGLQLVKKFPIFYGTRRFITALTSVHHLSVSRASPIQSTHPHPTSWRSILILSTHLRLGLPSGLFPSGFPTKTLYAPFPHPHAPHSQPISFFSILSPAQYWVSSTDHLAPRYAISSIHPFPRENFKYVLSRNLLNTKGTQWLHFSL